LACRFCHGAHGKRYRMFPSHKTILSIRTLDTRCLISTCKIPANWPYKGSGRMTPLNTDDPLVSHLRGAQRLKIMIARPGGSLGDDSLSFDLLNLRHRSLAHPKTWLRSLSSNDTYNLNVDFDDGEIRFPEYGPRSFKPPVGGAVVFSCSLLHAVSTMTRGRRYAFLPFLYDEAASQIRQANSTFLSEDGDAYEHS
jgi:hypothetical protein